MATETTNYGLTKPGYSDTADVADINENMDKIDGVLNYVSDAIGIVVDGDKTAYADGVEIGQFVILRNSTITGCDDGLYKAAKTIPYNTVIDSTYLTAEPSGAANALNASLKLEYLNGKVKVFKQGKVVTLTINGMQTGTSCTLDSNVRPQSTTYGAVVGYAVQNQGRAELSATSGNLELVTSANDYYYGCMAYIVDG